MWQTAYTQIAIILLSAILGYLIYRKQNQDQDSTTHFSIPLSRRFAIICLLLFLSLLIPLPILREVTSLRWMAMFDSFYRAGALVFGGGHVVLPLLENEFVPYGWLSEAEFLAGYGAA